MAVAPAAVPAQSITVQEGFSIGAGAGIAFVDGNSSRGRTQFACRAMLGFAYNVTEPFRRRR